MAHQQLEFEYEGWRPNPDSPLEVGTIMSHNDMLGQRDVELLWWSADEDLWEVEVVRTGARFMAREQDLS